ncbi:MAG: AAA family ATPase, partial [Pseudomonadota bacterium]
QAMGARQQGEIFASAWRQTMVEAIDEIARALAALGKPEPSSPDLKASDDFLDPLFRRFFEKLELPNLMAKTDYHTLAPFVRAQDIDPEVREKLDRIVEVAGRATPAREADE